MYLKMIWEEQEAMQKKYFPDVLVDELIDNLLNMDVESVNKQRETLWKELKSWSAKQSRGIYAIQYWMDQIKRTVFRCRYPVGMSVAFLSPDGGGKSTIIEEINNTCWGTFHYIY